MEENTKPPVSNQEEMTESVKRDAKGLFTSVKTFLRELLDIRSETDKDQTIEDVKNDIPFKGHTAWILIFSVFVASIGTSVHLQAYLCHKQCLGQRLYPEVSSLFVYWAQKRQLNSANKPFQVSPFGRLPKH